MSAALAILGLHAVRGDKPVLRGFNLVVEPGQVVALMGVSGAGKSTVLRVLAALEPFTQGIVEIGDVRLHPGPLPRESRLRALRRAVGMVFQSHALFPHLTALENVTLAPVHALGWPAAKARQTAMELLDGLGVGARANAYPRELSGGEAQRVAIARALAPDPSLLLMDEPTSALDPARRGALGESLRNLARGGRALLIATHDVEFALAHTDQVLVLHEGRLAEYGPTSVVLTRPSDPATRELLAYEKHAGIGDRE